MSLRRRRISRWENFVNFSTCKPYLPAGRCRSWAGLQYRSRLSYRATSRLLSSDVCLVTLWGRHLRIRRPAGVWWRLVYSRLSGPWTRTQQTARAAAASPTQSVDVRHKIHFRRDRFTVQAISPIATHLSVAWSVVCLSSVVCHIRAPCVNRSTDLHATCGVQWHIVLDGVTSWPYKETGNMKVNQSLHLSTWPGVSPISDFAFYEISFVLVKCFHKLRDRLAWLY